MQVIRGGFEVRPEDQSLISRQRALTGQINQKFVQVGAIFLKPSSKHPIDQDWYAKLKGDVDLQAWIDSEEHRALNAGFNLQFGWLDVDIDADDPEYNRCILAALDYLSVDTRFRFGRASVGVPSHVLVQLAEDESANYEFLKKFEPKEVRLGDKRYHTQLRSFPTNVDAKNLVKSAKQTVVPGSIYSSKVVGREYDVSVWFNKNGNIAGNVSDIAATTPRRSDFTTIVRSIAFGTILYLVRDQWVEGSRQSTATKLTGWLARIVKDSEAMNAQESIAAEVFCPVDSDAWAEKLIHFICDETDDEEKHMRSRAYYDAVEKLSRNPDAKVPGWFSMSELFGGEAMHAMRTVLMPGSDMTHLTKMAERYVYDEADNKYIDRQRHRTYSGYIHEGPELERRHKGDTIFVGGKPKEAFRVFEASQMRKRVGARDMFPDLEPGAIYRVDVMGNVIPDEADLESTVVFNTWKGWPIKPIDVVDPAIMARCEEKLDRLLGWLTRDNPTQMEWVKDWVSWIFQHPGQKQQIAWVVVGGQGVGKSFFGNTFMKALMTERLWGSASPKVIDQAFNIGPFKDKMFVFIDEAKFHGDSGTEEIKKLIRNTDISGMEKFEEARDYRIYSRIMFASNRFDMGIGQRDVTDRALFYTRAYDKDHLHLSELQFREWTNTLKPFFDDFGEMLKDQDVIRHYLRMFMDRPADRHAIESIRYSSGADVDIVSSNMSWARRVAKAILESGWIAADDMAIEIPFTAAQFNERVLAECQSQGLPRIQPNQIRKEFMEADILDLNYSEDGHRMMRMKFKYGKTIRMFELASGLVLDPYRDPVEGDDDENTATSKSRLRKLPGKASISGKL